jgi:hypothetical protein
VIWRVSGRNEDSGERWCCGLGGSLHNLGIRLVFNRIDGGIGSVRCSGDAQMFTLGDIVGDSGSKTPIVVKLLKIGLSAVEVSGSSKQADRGKRTNERLLERKRVRRRI